MKLIEPDRRIYGIGLGGWIYPKKITLQNSQKASNLFKISSWNHFRVYCSETKALTFMNNQLISETNELHANEGKFGIQHHGKGAQYGFGISVPKIISSSKPSLDPH